MVAHPITQPDPGGGRGMGHIEGKVRENKVLNCPLVNYPTTVS